MQERHKDRKRYFDEQGITTDKFVIPYISDTLTIDDKISVLEIGCGEGGNMVPFVNRGCKVVGIDLNESQINNARKYFDQMNVANKPIIIFRDIYDVSENEIGLFDLIVMRDVIEHIHNQERFMAYVKKFLKPNGKIFFGFPPWRMPFGGHQQVLRSKLLSNLPYYHILPKSIYAGILKLFGEEASIPALLEIKDTGISIHRFESIVKNEKYLTLKKDLWFINPNYQTKFGLKPRKLFGVIASLPFLKDFFTTCYYCVIQKNN